MKFKKMTNIIKNKNRLTIFCDMDGVLTDFEKRFKDIPANIKGLSPSQYNEKYGKSSIWKIIEPEGIKWWSEMEWTKDGKALWDYLKSFKPTILSAPSRDPKSKEGKLMWINNNLDISQKFFTINPKKWKPSYRIILNSNKHLFAKTKYDILIDDTYSKIEKWEKAGGTAIHHKNTLNTIRKLNTIISRFNSD